MSQNTDYERGNFRIILANGYIHVGFDERDTDGIIGGIDAEYDGLPDDWCWLADLNVKKDQVVAIQRIPHGSTDRRPTMAEKNTEPDRTERTVWRVTAADVDAIIGREATDDELESMALAAVARLRPTVDRGPQP